MRKMSLVAAVANVLGLNKLWDSIQYIKPLDRTVSNNFNYRKQPSKYLGKRHRSQKIRANRRKAKRAA